MNESSGGGPQGGGGGGEQPPGRGRGRGRGWNPSRGRGRGKWPRKSANSDDVRAAPNSYHYDDNRSRDGSHPAFRGNEPEHSYNNTKRGHQQQRKSRGAGGQHRPSRGHLEDGFYQMGLSEEHLSRNNYYEDNGRRDGGSASFRGYDQSHSNNRGYHHHQQHQRTYRDGGEGSRSHHQREDRPNPRHRHTTNTRQEENFPQMGLGEEDWSRNGEGQPSNCETRGDKTKKINKSNKSRTRRKDQGGRSEEKDSNLRSRLTDLCLKGMSECMVCLEKVKQHQATWDCRNCYQIFHLGCVKKWARSATLESGWRCPGCQVVVETLPKEYRCFCRKMLRPEWFRNEGLVPHSCGEVCGRALAVTSDSVCPHTCLDLCHPGPCDLCRASLRKTCPCGALTRLTRCDTGLLCGGECGRLLNCGRHTCTALCHEGPCQDCQVTVDQECHCGKTSRQTICSPESEVKFSCEGECGRTLDCGRHQCSDVCHGGDCPPCPLTPARVPTCPCGRTRLEGEKARADCTEDIPVCGSVCDKILACGPPSAPHQCQADCHLGPCPPCPLTTSVRCRCGFMDQDLPCAEMTSRADDARCGRRCQKKRSCGRHKCGELCCIRLEHPCPLICNKLLSCRLHNCQDSCHTGNCHSCHNVSFSELSCHCGAAVIYPPVPCGTRPPDCAEPCRREHPCGHPVHHSCHSEAVCPPCTQLTNKRCYCGREERRNIACLVEGVSCGKLCGRPLSCGRHRCAKICHPGQCETGKCLQPCTAPRSCGHPCLAPCHQGECPDTLCPTKVKLTCDCGRRQTTSPCSENSFSTLTTSLLASQMADIRSGNSVDLSELAKKNKKIECNEECFKVARNAQLASALQIDNPELSSKVIPRYSDFMKDWFKRDPTFCSTVHSKLVELVKLSKDSKQKGRSHSFPVMNRDKRQLVHEMAAIFSCESQSYDAEPKRNVVVTALREKSSIPSVSLAEFAAKQKKAPTPKPDTTDSDCLPTYTTLTRSGSEAKIDWFG